jgi:hypothetical protein
MFGTNCHTCEPNSVPAMPSYAHPLFCVALVLLSLVHTASAKTALVLAGGGAKGAITLGYLEAICQSDLANSWDMVVGGLSFIPPSTRASTRTQNLIPISHSFP